MGSNALYRRFVAYLSIVLMFGSAFHPVIAASQCCCHDSRVAETLSSDEPSGSCSSCCLHRGAEDGEQRSRTVSVQSRATLVAICCTDHLENDGDSESPCPTCRVRPMEPAAVSVSADSIEFEWVCEWVSLDSFVASSARPTAGRLTSDRPLQRWRDICVSLERWLI